MADNVRILLLEDFLPDIDIISAELNELGFNYELAVCDNQKSYNELIADFKPAVILSDFYLKDFTGFEALKIRNEKKPDVPFILITGSISEEVAVKCMKMEADDYILKDQIKRLPFSITEALKLREIKEEKNRALKSLFESEKKFRFLAERAHDLVYRIIMTPGPVFDFLSPSAFKLTGHTPEEFYSDPQLINHLVHHDDLNLFEGILKGDIPDDPVNIRFIRKDGTVFWTEHSIVGICNISGSLTAIEGTARDITDRKIYEEKLSESEKVYRYLFENNPKPMWVYDTESLRFLAVNDSAILHYGFSKAEFLSMTIRDIRPAGELPKLLSFIQEYTDVYRHSTGWKHLRKDGRILYSEIDSHEILFAGKRSRLELVTDITAKRVVEEKLNLISRAVERTPVSITITDLAGRILYVNHKNKIITGYSFEEIIDTVPYLLSREFETKNPGTSLRDIIMNGADWEGEFINSTKSGEQYWESALVSSIKNLDGEITNFVIVEEDITEKKNILQEMIRAKEKAEEMSRLKTNFLANMSHELRTPMIGILGYSELIQEISVKTEVKTLSERLNKSACRLMETLNLILELSKIEAEKIKVNIQKIEAVSVIKDAAEDFENAAKSKNIEFELKADPPEIYVDSDERFLRSIIHNLVSNAVKFTDTGFVRILIRTDENHEGKDLVIMIADTGIGIPVQYHKVIFEEFRQVSEGYGRNYEGTGLGLSLAKRMTEKLGGSISLKSEPGKGTEFTLRFKV
ncbi:MAG: PAS domain S-box protein [Ignavibacteriaceae bacterium]|nr:PAS domain S-box protein [Ignavibacteriaceae bacterium]